MDAFEQLCSEIFFRQGYWVQNSVKVDLTKPEKVAIRRPSSPRWELDLLAYSGKQNRLLALECKSYIDSRGVTLADLQADSKSTRYKLFREPATRKIVLKRLVETLTSRGFVAEGCEVRFGLIAGKIKGGDAEGLATYFAEQDWELFGPDWLKRELHALAGSRYSNDISAVVSKLILR